MAEFMASGHFQRHIRRMRRAALSRRNTLLAHWPQGVEGLGELPAIVAADAAYTRPGARISLFITGARGDADVWTFEVMGAETVATADGQVEHALHLHREPRQRFDSLVDVWLDPARSYLPVRLRLGVAETNDSNEFLLHDIVSP